MLFSAGIDGGQTRRLFSVRSDGTDVVDFAARKGPKDDIPKASEVSIGDDMVSLLPGDEKHVLVAYQYDPGFRAYTTDVYKLNIETGRSRLLSHSTITRATGSPMRRGACDSASARAAARHS